ncbi:MAG: 2-aminoethylphosphonate--pyruvate transaminase [Carboxylicivirga sp.]|jgi:2-aminoethylphosphonate-pyruvate transaminase|nr:2-aminoethylphosphonate--pyruvate transaminase [Carboxylicivirga sp.]
MQTLSKDKRLFTPGPLTTSSTVKQAMVRDLGSRDAEFIHTVKEIRQLLLQVADIDKLSYYDAILMQGAGTYGVESVITTVIPEDGHLLVIKNGAYGQRIENMARISGIRTSALSFDEAEIPDAVTVDSFLSQNATVTHVAIVHCETTTGIFNDINSIGKLVKEHGATYIVDAMSSFGAVPIDFQAAGIDYLISSSNKCIEGVPGFSFIIANSEKLKLCKGHSRTLSLDLFEQWAGLNTNGQFRFTPPIQSMMAFKQALLELCEEGGVEARAERYQQNNDQLLKGMEEMGFKPYLDKAKRGYIITSFYYPDEQFDFQEFYNLLNEEDLVIYPGKLSKADCFRIGNIGQLYPEDIKHLLHVIRIVTKKLNIN